MKKIYVYATLLLAMMFVSIPANAQEENEVQKHTGFLYYNYGYDNDNNLTYDNNMSKEITIEISSDGIYTLKNLYSEGYDMVFSINEDGTLNILNSVGKDEYDGYYVKSGEEDTNRYIVYTYSYSDSGNTYYYSSADKITDKNITIWWSRETPGGDWGYDMFIWKDETPLMMQNCTGYLYYNYSVDANNNITCDENKSKNVTMNINNDQTYTFKNIYGEGNDLIFSENEDGTMNIVNSIYKDSYGYYFITDNISLYVNSGYSGIDEISDKCVSVWWYRSSYENDNYVYGYDWFYWDAETSGISDINADKSQIRIIGNKVVSNNANLGINVYNTAGKLEYSGLIKDMNSLNSGIHIVKAAGKIFKIMIK